MFSKPLAFALLAVGCLTAAAGGAYVATRHNTADVAAAPPAATVPAPQPSSVAATPAPVSETEAAVSPAAPPLAPVRADAEKEDPPAAPVARPKRAPQTATPAATRSARVTPQRTLPMRDRAAVPQAPANMPAPLPQVVTPAPVAANGAEPKVEAPQPVDPQPEPPREPQFEELVLPASSVIGLQVETPLSSERARLEDRVDARVTRDVLANGRVAIPAGSRVFGSVTLVDRGGKVKGTARLGIRFHTLVLADGSEVALNTEPFYREGESQAGDSAKKIGGATAVGAILGGILGGGKGAVIGGATGAAGGTAAAMAGDRSAAVVAPGSIVTVHLATPATIMVEKK